MKVVSNNDNNGKVVYSSEIIKSVVDCAISEIEGVVKHDKQLKSLRHDKNYVRVDYVGDDIYVDVYVKLMYNVSVSEVASKIQHTIKTTLESMTEFKIKDVNVHVVDVEFSEN